MCILSPYKKKKNWHKSKEWQITDRAALSAITDLVMARWWQHGTASNSLASCWNVIACFCSYQTSATFMSPFLSAPSSNLWHPLHGKQEFHKQCSLPSFLTLSKSFFGSLTCRALRAQNPERLASKICHVHTGLFCSQCHYWCKRMVCISSSNQGYTVQFCLQLNGQSVDTFLATKELFCSAICQRLFPCFHLFLCCEKMCLSGRLSLLLGFGKNNLFFWKLSHFFLVSRLVRTLRNSGLGLSCHHAPTLDSSPFKAAKTSYTCYINYILHTAVDRYIKNTGDKLLNSWSWYSCGCALPGRPVWILFQDEANSRWPPRMGTSHPVLSDLDILNNSSYFSSFSQEDVAV